jgi:L-ascorbate metabolism protein UlaG (beta-lactamase superfamily)
VSAGESMSIEIRWLGHSGFQIKTEKENIYIDIYRTKELQKRVPDVSETGTIILATHSHGDHCHPESIESVTDKDSIVIAPEDCREKIKGNFQSISTGDEIEIRNIKIKAVHAYNTNKFRSPGNPYHPKDYGVGYLISIGGKTIYHAGDTDFIPEMSDLGPIDVAMLPVGDTYTMNNTEAGEAALEIKPKIVVPMHTWDKGVEKFIDKVKENPEIKIMVMSEDEMFSI